MSNIAIPALLAMLAVGGAVSPSFAQTTEPPTVIDGHLPDLRFRLTASDGTTVTESAYRGKIVLLYFGYGGCSTQCPLALARLAHIVAEMGDAAADFRVLFVSIDPRHDTPQSLRRFTAAFDARSIEGLVGDERETVALARRYRTVLPTVTGRGDRTHSDTVYIFDRHGRARLLATPETGDEALRSGLQKLARSETP